MTKETTLVIIDSDDEESFAPQQPSTSFIVIDSDDEDDKHSISKKVIPCNSNSKNSQPHITPHSIETPDPSKSLLEPIYTSLLKPLASSSNNKKHKKLSLPRSQLISKSSSNTSQVGKPSAIVKAASPVRKPSLTTTFKRPIELPDRPPSQSIFKQSPIHTLLLHQKRSIESFYHKKDVIHSIPDEDGKEEALENLVEAIQNTIPTVKVSSIRQGMPVNAKCPLCEYLIPKEELEMHASECTGEIDNHIIQNPRVIRKRTIADAIRLDESERKKLNKGKVDTGPTNYYADSESILALDGNGFNSEVTGMTWESAGQTRFGG